MLTSELQSSPLFEGLSAGQLALLAPWFTRQKCRAGEVLFSQGDRADKVYVLEEGRVHLCFRPEDGGWIVIATLTEPDRVFGWSAVLGHRLYTSSAICLNDTLVWQVSGADLRAAFRAEAGLSVLFNRMLLSVAQRFSPERQGFVHWLQDELNRARP